MLCRQTLVLAVAAMVAAAGCQKTDPALKEDLAQIKEDLAFVKAQLARPGGVRAGAAAQGPRPGQPSSTDVYAVAIDPGDPVEGPATAKVTIVEAAEFACPFCYRAAGTVTQLREQYGDDLRIVWKNYVVHPAQAQMPAQAVCAAHDQGKGWAYVKKSWELIWAGGQMGDTSEAKLVEVAKALQLDADKFTAKMKSDECRKEVEEDMKVLSQVGTRGTPAFYINGRFINGARPIEQFKAVIDEELKKAEAAIKGGTRAEDYYSSIVAKGKKSVQ